MCIYAKQVKSFVTVTPHFKMSKFNQFQMFVLDLRTDDRILVEMDKDGQQNEVKHFPIVN